MSRKKYLRRFVPVLFAGLMVLGLSSCEKDEPIADEFEVVTPGNTSGDQEVVTVSAPTAILGNLGDVEAELMKCFTNIVALKDAKIILVGSGAINENEEALSEAYEKGVLIAVINPDGNVVADWSDRNNIFYAGPEDDETCTIYGFNNKGTYYTLHPSDDIDDEGVPLFHFCNWANEESAFALRGIDLRSKDIKKRFASQHVTHTFNLSLDEQLLVNERWASKGQLNLKTTANVSYTIYPIHVFDENAKGDYYAVEAEVVLHNAPMNNGSWIRRTGDAEAEFRGLFMKSCDVTANLLRKTNGSIVASTTHQFAEGATPQPESIEDAASYNSGFEWTLDATVAGGIPDSKDNHKLTAFNNWTWSSLAKQSLEGIFIKKDETSSNVKYTLGISGNEGHNNQLSIPEAASGDLKFNYSWIWRVSDVDENTKDKLYMQVDVNPVYKAYQYISAENKTIIGEFANTLGEGRTAFRFPIVPPSRVATASAIIRNTSTGSYYIRDIKLWRNKTTDKEPDIVVPQTISTSTATGGSGVSAIMVIIPAGEYYIEGVRYSMKDGNPVDEHVIKNTTPIKVVATGNITIDLGSDQFTII